MVDFIFFYEHKQRELESVVLLKTELERRGYTVALYGAYEKNRLEVLPLKKLKPKVAVLSALYTPSVLSYFSTSLIGFNRKIANLQWEQILFHCEEINPECKQNVFGFVQNAMHFCWGEKSRKRIVDNGVPAVCQTKDKIF